MSKTSSTIIALMIMTGTASAQGRPDSTRMSCTEAAGYIRAQGAAVLGTGGMSYDRYVSDRRFCAPTEGTKVAFAPTRDTQYCPIGYTCFERFTSSSDTNPR